MQHILSLFPAVSLWSGLHSDSLLSYLCLANDNFLPSHQKLFYFFLPAALSPMNTKILSLKSPCRFKRRSLSQHGLSHLRAWTWSYFRQSWTLPMVKGHPCVTKLILYSAHRREPHCGSPLFMPLSCTRGSQSGHSQFFFLKCRSSATTMTTLTTMATG